MVLVWRYKNRQMPKLFAGICAVIKQLKHNNSSKYLYVNIFIFRDWSSC